MQRRRSVQQQMLRLESSVRDLVILRPRVLKLFGKITDVHLLAGVTNSNAARVAAINLKDDSGPSSSPSWMKPRKKLKHKGSSPSSHLTSPLSPCLTLPGSPPTLTIDSHHNTSSESQTMKHHLAPIICVAFVLLQSILGYDLPPFDRDHGNFGPQCTTDNDCQAPKICCHDYRGAPSG